jgi:hypothetical protein
VREECEALIARDAALGGSRGSEKVDAVGNGGAVKLRIATTRQCVPRARCARVATNDGESRKVPAPSVKWQRRGHA